MDRLSGLLAFARTAELGSFIAAGRALGISASAVGKSVARLEQELGVRLLQRSTRRIGLTEEGRLFNERVRRILDDIDDAEAMLSRTREMPHGRLRVSTPIVTYHLLLPVLSEFMARYPEIELDIDFNDRIVDVIEEGIDVAIRSGELPDSRLVARPLAPFRLLLCAAPSYLERHGTPRVPADLARHFGIRFRFPNSGKLQEWPFIADRSDPRSMLTCNNMEALKGATIAGLGIGCMPDFLVREALRDGRLCTVLDDHVDGRGQFRMLWPSNRHLSPKVRVLVDFLPERLAVVR
ncbi:MULTISPECIES: LysR family transcriptional regulator [Mesorhizobium]|uniref:LysR family transcriptional regulator n=1 Tax=Rhizobium loti TaxID=381 RepID=A0A6M7TX93_RHILI|nr:MULTISPECIES: LysR family transcriptional regulator [Mesorhizobium]KRB19216.1 LysR family transcriptional regulator [Mesorhizobium sp. Root172]OBQ70846.1 LysR family transcriptional regulator [Mesorhizobium loti]QKC69649.1 LysR family transcriptional regulator [Mesorhizobium loti]